MSTKYNISTPTNLDLEKILQLYYESSKEILGITDISTMIRYDEQKYGPNYKFLNLENLKQWFERKTDAMLVAKDTDGNILGFIIFYVPHDHPNIGYIEEIHVQQEYRHKGIGSALLALAEKRLFSNENIKGIFLESQMKAVHYFLSRGYIPLRKEKELYMDRLEYYDMIKLRKDYRSAIEIAINSVGTAHEMYVQIEEVVKSLTDLGVKSEYIGSIYLLLYAEVRDNDTQSYIPLAKEIRKYASEILERNSLYKNIFDALFQRIIAYGEIDMGNYLRASSRLKVAHEKFTRILNVMRKDFVWQEYPYIHFVKYIECYASFVNTLKSFAIIYGRYRDTHKTVDLEEFKRNAEIVSKACSKYPETITELRTIIQSIDKLQSAVEKLKDSGEIPSGMFSGTIHFVNFFKIEGYKNKFGTNLSRDDVISAFKQVIGEDYTKETSDLIISEDVLPDIQLSQLENQVHLITNHVTLNCRVSDKLFRDFAKSKTLDIAIFDNGTGIAVLKVDFVNQTPLDLYHITFLGNTSILEHSVYIGKYKLKLRDFKEDYENWNPLWLAVKNIIERVSKELNLGNVQMVCEPINYTILEINNAVGEKSELLRNYPSFLGVVDRDQTSMVGASAAFRKFYFNKYRKYENIATSMDLENVEIYASDIGALLYGKNLAQWVINELIELILLLTYQRFYLYTIYLHLSEMITETENESSKMVEQFTSLRKEIIKELWMLTNPLPLRYREYLEFVKQVRTQIGIKNIETLINGQLESISRVIEIDEISALHDLQYKSEHQREMLDYIATIVGVLGVGEVVWRILTVIEPQIPAFFLIVVYAILTLIGLILLKKTQIKE